TRLDEVLVAVVLEQLLDLVAGGITASQNPQANRTYVHPALRNLYRTDIDRRYICSQVRNSSCRRKLTVRHWVARCETVQTSEKSIAMKVLNDLDAVDFDALLALAGGIADTLFRLQDLHPRPAQRAGVDVDVAGTRVRHHEAKA